nr:MAG TPA: hypothetical protein [Caudoviricetes sp.]
MFNSSFATISLYSYIPMIKMCLNSWSNINRS